MLLSVSFNMHWPSLWGELCCFLFTWHWLKLSGSPLWACWAVSHSAACTNPGGSACPLRTLQVSLLTPRCSWWPMPQVPLDSSTAVRYIMGWTGTDKRGGVSDKKFSKTILQRTLSPVGGKRTKRTMAVCRAKLKQGNTASCLCFRNSFLKFWWKKHSYNLATFSFSSFTLWKRDMHFNILNTLEYLRPQESQIQGWHQVLFSKIWELGRVVTLQRFTLHNLYLLNDYQTYPELLQHLPFHRREVANINRIRKIFTSWPQECSLPPLSLPFNVTQAHLLKKQWGLPYQFLGQNKGRRVS